MSRYVCLFLTLVSLAAIRADERGSVAPPQSNSHVPVGEGRPVAPATAKPSTPTRRPPGEDMVFDIQEDCLKRLTETK